MLARTVTVAPFMDICGSHCLGLEFRIFWLGHQTVHPLSALDCLGFHELPRSDELRSIPHNLTFGGCVSVLGLSATWLAGTPLPRRVFSGLGFGTRNGFLLMLQGWSVC